MKGRRTSLSAAVFADTSAYFALAAHTDQHHGAAEVLLRQASLEKRLLYTSNFVLAETHALILHRLKPGRGASPARTTALRTVQRLYEGARQTGTLVRVTPADETRAFEILTEFADKDFTFTDATSYPVMERLGISLAFSFDDDFVQAGFARLS